MGEKKEKQSHKTVMWKKENTDTQKKDDTIDIIIRITKIEGERTMAKGNNTEKNKYEKEYRKRRT